LSVTTESTKRQNIPDVNFCRAIIWLKLIRKCSVAFHSIQKMNSSLHPFQRLVSTFRIFFSLKLRWIGHQLYGFTHILN
jgi:hypothetical protein